MGKRRRNRNRGQTIKSVARVAGVQDTIKLRRVWVGWKGEPRCNAGGDGAGELGSELRGAPGFA